MATSAAPMNGGRYGSSRVRLPIQAPLNPRPTRISGPRQQVEARIAARPPSANAWLSLDSDKRILLPNNLGMMLGNRPFAVRSGRVARRRRQLPDRDDHPQGQAGIEEPRRRPTSGRNEYSRRKH